MWSAIRSVTAKGLLVGSAAEGKALVPTAGRIVVSAAAGARVLPAGRAFTPVLRCSQAQARGLVATAVQAATARTTTAKKVPAKKPAVKKTTAKAAGKKKVAAKKPAAKKKTTTKIRAKKTKAVAKKTKRPRKVLTDEEKVKLRIRELKKVALLKQPAKQPETAWVAYVSEKTKGVTGSSIASNMASISEAFKALSSSELQRLRDQAAKNATTNAAQFKAWVKSHSVAEVAEANRARAQLTRLGGPKRRQIPDERMPKRPMTAYSLFTKTQWATGKFSGVPLAESGKTIASEWKALSESERKSYEQATRAGLEQYAETVDSLLGRTRKSASPAH